MYFTAMITLKFWSHVLPGGGHCGLGSFLVTGPMSFPGGWIFHHMSFPGGRVSLGVVSREYGIPYTTHPPCPEKATATVGMHPTGTLSCFNYHPQTKFAKVMFLQVVCLSTGGLPSPLARHPLRLVHAGIHPTLPPSPRGYYGIRSTSGWYSSHSCYLNS